MGRQMSTQWVNSNIRKLLNSDDLNLVSTGLLLRQAQAGQVLALKGNVLNKQFVNRWNKFQLSEE